MVSIIIPTYNAEKYIEACIESLINQTTREPLQIIVVDDGSEDKTVSLTDRFADRPATPVRSLTLLEKTHAGQSAARNVGLRHAKGEYIAFVDADDTLEPDWCERHMAAIEGVDYVQSGYKRVKVKGQRDKGQWTKVQRLTTGSVPQRPKHRYQFTSPCMRMYRREAIEGMQFEEGMIYEDVVWSVDLWQRKLRCRTIPCTGYLYTLNPASTTSRPHPEAQRRLFATLRQRAKNASLRGKMIIAYTILRLKIHFLQS